jgi:hypothetical protein
MNDIDSKRIMATNMVSNLCSFEDLRVSFAFVNFIINMELIGIRLRQGLPRNGQRTSSNEKSKKIKR